MISQSNYHVWQIGAGDAGRDYSRLFLNHDLMFLGPGRYGPYEPAAYDRVAASGAFTRFKVSMVASFCKEVRPGDIVLLRRGHDVVAVGLVPEGDGYEHREMFDDVFGWDLQHTRRVVWQTCLTTELTERQKTRKLFSLRKQIPTFTRVKDQGVLGPVRELFDECRPRAMKSLPPPLPPPMSLEELGQKLFACGLANQAVDQVQRAIERQRRLLEWYREYGKASARPDEQEVVAHMIIPLLLALGWSEQLLALQWHRVDLAGFRGTPTTKENCVLVCEAKRLSHGLQTTLEQAKRYVRDLPLNRCRQILLTQGGRFYLYRRFADGTWPGDAEDRAEPFGYFNVERLRTNHIAPANTNAVDTLMNLTPAGAAAVE